MDVKDVTILILMINVVMISCERYNPCIGASGGRESTIRTIFVNFGNDTATAVPVHCFYRDGTEEEDGWTLIAKSSSLPQEISISWQDPAFVAGSIDLDGTALYSLAPANFLSRGASLSSLLMVGFDPNHDEDYTYQIDFNIPLTGQPTKPLKSGNDYNLTTIHSYENCTNPPSIFEALGWCWNSSYYFRDVVDQDQCLVNNVPFGLRSDGWYLWRRSCEYSAYMHLYQGAMFAKFSLDISMNDSSTAVNCVYFPDSQCGVSNVTYQNLTLQPDTVQIIPANFTVIVQQDLVASQSSQLTFKLKFQDEATTSGTIQVNGTVYANGIVQVEIPDDLPMGNFNLTLLTCLNFQGDFNVTSRDVCGRRVTPVKTITSFGVSIFNLKCQQDFQLENSPSETERYVEIFVPMGIGLLLVVVVVSIILWRTRRNFAGNSEETRFLKDVQVSDQALGEGRFGKVFLGTWVGNQVACKHLKEGDIESFTNEIETLRSLRHPNVVQYMGIFIENSQTFLVTEYMAKGSLKNYIETHLTTLEDLVNIAVQCAAGMLHLSQHKIFHRDLAMRNILVASSSASGVVIKISDFGMSSKIPGNSDMQILPTDLFPIRWTAIEVLNDCSFSPKSDNWSFGILLWEIFSRGALPYFNLNTSDVLPYILAGNRLSPPRDCPGPIRDLMTRCWKMNPLDRPNFDEISRTLIFVERSLGDGRNSRRLSSVGLLSQSQEEVVIQVEDYVYDAAPADPKTVPTVPRGSSMDLGATESSDSITLHYNTPN